MKYKTSRRSFLVSCAAPVFALAVPSQRDVLLLKTPEGGLQPQAVVDASGVLHLVYLYGNPAAADIGYVRREPGEIQFSNPIRVNDRPGSAIALGTVRGARIAIGKAGHVHVAWNGSGKSARMFYARIDERRRRFEPQRDVMPSITGLDGGGTVAADSAGNVYVACHAQGQRDGRPIQGEGNRRVWLARSSDDGKTFAREAAVSPEETGACGCCGMGALADSTGNLYLLYRSARAVVHRDMYLLVSRDKGATFHATDLQPWEIGACPMSTVSLAEAGKHVFFSWETDKQVYFSKYDGKPVAAPGAGRNRKHPAIAASRNGNILLSWTEDTGWNRGGSLKWQVFDSDQRPDAPLGEAQVVPAWGLGTAAAVRDQFLLIC